VRIGVVGTGYVGLVTGACLAELGHEVCCVDRDATRIALLDAGGCPLYEPGLEDVISRNHAAGRLRFSTEVGEAVARRSVVFIAVGTPQGPGGEADLGAVEAAAREIGEHLDHFAVIAIKSTVPVGTGEAVAALLAESGSGTEHAVISNPEFLREGCAIKDFMAPDRIVVGTANLRARAVMGEVYRPLTSNGVRLVLTDTRTSELIKYASNAFLAVKISYINEIADLCEDLGADAARVAEGMGLDARIGSRFLQPGPGYGGSCFPKDTQALLATGRAVGAPLRVVAAAEAANAERKRLLCARIAAVAGDLAGKTVGVLGLAFKAGTDDIRDAAALVLIPDLQLRGARVRAFDPQAMQAARGLLPSVTFCADAYSAAEEADAVVILTEWPEFRALDLSRLRKAARRPLLIDFRNLFSPEAMSGSGLDYVSVGRRAASGRRRRRSDGALSSDPLISVWEEPSPG
jgi:UDPglucose 6-dehydrogenase